MTTAEFLDFMNSGSQVTAQSDVHRIMHGLSQEAIRITMEINSRYHTPEEINALLSELTGCWDMRKSPQGQLFDPCGI